MISDAGDEIFFGISVYESLCNMYKKYLDFLLNLSYNIIVSTHINSCKTTGGIKMSTRKKNIIAQRILSALLLVLSIVGLPYLDYDITAHIIIVPLSLYLLFTREAVMEIF